VEPRRGRTALQQTLQQCQVKARIQGRFWRVTVRSWNVTAACQTRIIQWGKDTPPVWQIMPSKKCKAENEIRVHSLPHIKVQPNSCQAVISPTIAQNK
jgi:hypothetical protein